MVNWDELVVPMVSSDNHPETFADSDPADPWDMFDSIGTGIAIMDASATLVRCNSAFSKPFAKAATLCRPGVAMQQVLVVSTLGPLDCTNSKREAPGVAPAWVERFFEAFQSNGSTDWRDPNGHWWRARFTALPKGQRLCEVTDISTEMRLEKERSQLAEVKSSDQPMVKGLAHMGHELRTPLNAILGFSDLIRSQALGPLGNDSYAEYAQDIYNSGQCLLTAVDRIAFLVKLEAGLVRPQSANVPFAVIAETAVEAVQSQAQQADIGVEAAPASPALDVYIDRNLFGSVLTFLLENAIAATPPGGKVELRALPSDDAGLAVEVVDHGKGISSDQMEAIMQPFVRFDAANPNVQAGVGMGLPLIARIAPLLGCRFEIESEPGTGTIARLVLPSDRLVQD